MADARWAIRPDIQRWLLHSPCGAERSRMSPSRLKLRRIALLGTAVAALIVPSGSASAAHRTHQAAATLTVSFFDSTGAPGTLLRLPRNRIVVRRTTAGRIAVGRRRFRVLGRGRAPIRLKVRVDPVAGQLTIRAGRRK